MTYSKKDNEMFALKLLLMEALAVFQERRNNKELLKIIKCLGWKK